MRYDNRCHELHPLPRSAPPNPCRPPLRVHAQVILPSDFVVGDIEVDEHGPLPGQTPRDDDDDGDDADDGGGGETEIERETEQRDGEGEGREGVAGGTGDEYPAADGSNDGETAAAAEAAVEVEPDDRAMGFEYDGEVL